MARRNLNHKDVSLHLQYCFLRFLYYFEYHFVFLHHIDKIEVSRQTRNGSKRMQQ